MAKRVRRELKRRRFRGEALATDVIGWLNGKEREYCGKASRASRQRILDLIVCMRMTLETIAAESDWGSTNRPPQRVRSWEGELNRRLAKYPTIPIFNVDRGQKWSFDIG